MERPVLVVMNNVYNSRIAPRVGHKVTARQPVGCMPRAAREATLEGTNVDLVTCRQGLVVMSLVSCKGNEVTGSVVWALVKSPILKTDGLVKASLLEQGYLMRIKNNHGCATGDQVRADVPKGKKTCLHRVRLARYGPPVAYSIHTQHLTNGTTASPA